MKWSRNATGWLVGCALLAGSAAVGLTAPRAARPAARKPAVRKPVAPQPARPAPQQRPAAPAPAAAAAPAALPPQIAAAIAGRPAATPEQAEFFETRVRPVLAERCYSCHGPKLQQSGLRVDTLAGLLRGTDAGHASLVPGEPDRSPLIQVLLHTGPVKMPPGNKLPQAEIDALTEWVRMGAPWPGAEKQVGTESAPDPTRHWAFQPVRAPAEPRVKNRAWVRTPIDAFVLAQLEAKGLGPSSYADRRTLIRRAYNTLLGLPPTAEEVEAFVADREPNAWGRLIDRLLESPHYGERWARYWMDIARYADNKGYVFTEERRFPYAYTYRDYLIRSFNEDKPYDRFLVEQLAADQLELGEDKRPLAAMGFLTLGRRFLGNIHDIIDDRMDVVMRGTQGLTIGCARCHDHKFDPISLKDYYALYGVFAASTEPAELPLIAEPEQSASYLAFEKRLKELQAAADGFRDTKHNEVLARARAKIADSLLAARELAQPGADLRAIAQARDLPAPLVRRWATFLQSTRTGHAVFAPWHAFVALPEAGFAAAARALCAEMASGRLGGTPLNAAVAQAFSSRPPTTLKEAAEAYARLLESPPAEDQERVHALDSIGGPLNLNPEESVQLYNRAERDRLAALRREVESFRANSPDAPPRAMVLVDVPNPPQPRIFKRGNPNNPGDPVERSYITLLAGPQPPPFKKGSGRLELAQAIVDPRNPLTARVMVNRVWAYHMGSPLVNTPSDFGVRSDPPTNPALLDYLADRFVREGWSLKKLHRLILNSSVFMQRSDDRPEARARDPENALYWRANRRRLDFEALRDGLLAASGRLDRTLFGPSVEITRPPFSPRRSVYGFIDRQNLPSLFRTFDFASPDTTSPARFQTTVPQQALFLMNNPFPVEQARALVARKEIAEQGDPAARVRLLYRAVLARNPEPAEAELALRFLRAAEALGTEGAAQDVHVWQYGYGGVEEATGKVRSFNPLPHFTGNTWQGGATLPDARLGWVALNAGGGHPGNDAAHAAIRRWTAPRDMTVAVEGMLRHSQPQGDGVRARIVASGGGTIATWRARGSSAETRVAKLNVRRGETLDFVVDCLGGPDHDTFEWAPVVRAVETPGQPASAESGKQSVWSAASGFGGPRPAQQLPLTPWERLAQALLLSNEFVFVD